jgi:hypothetical protein
MKTKTKIKAGNRRKFDHIGNFNTDSTNNG